MAEGPWPRRPRVPGPQRVVGAGGGGLAQLPHTHTGAFWEALPGGILGAEGDARRAVMWRLIGFWEVRHHLRTRVRLFHLES